MIKRFLASLLFMLAAGSAAFAQTYPVTNPTYIPTAQAPATACTAACDIYFTLNGVTDTTVQITGTFTGLTAAVRVSNQTPDVSNASATWTTASIVPFGGGTPVSSVSGTTTGMWTLNTAGLTRLNVHVTAISTGTVTVSVAGTPGGAAIEGVVLNNIEGTIAPGTAPSKMAAVGGVYNSTPPTATNGQALALQLDNDGTLYVNTRDDSVVAADPCASRSAVKSSVLVNITSATTTQLVALSGTTKVYACGFNATLGASTSVAFEYGTGSSCGTGTTLLTGALTMGTTGGMVNVGGGEATAITAIAGNALCAVSTGTGGIQGVLTYVQQ